MSWYTRDNSMHQCVCVWQQFTELVCLYCMCPSLKNSFFPPLKLNCVRVPRSCPRQAVSTVNNGDPKQIHSTTQPIYSYRYIQIMLHHCVMCALKKRCRPTWNIIVPGRNSDFSWVFFCFCFCFLWLPKHSGAHEGCWEVDFRYIRIKLQRAAWQESFAQR